MTYSEQIICTLKELDVVYRDCNGVIQGDCGMCAGTSGGIVSNTITFNPATDQLTTIVNGIAASVTMSFGADDIVTSGALTIGGTEYPAGTSIEDIITALVALSHLEATVDGASNPALSVDVPTQVFTLDLTVSGSFDNGASGLSADNIQDAIDEIADLTASFTSPGSLGDFLIHNGTSFVKAQYIEETKTGLSSTIVTLATTPMTGAPFTLFRNGSRQVITDDFTRSGATLTLASSLIPSDKITATYYV
jgi:hypothetical protein